MNRKELNEYIAQTYGVTADFPWMKYPDYGVYRHKDNRKWFAVVMNIPKSKVGLSDDGLIDIMNIKCGDILTGSLRSQYGFFPAYHMNKTNWISVALDGSVESEQIKWLLDISFEATRKRSK